MLRQLYIQNYAIIDTLRIDFTEHLNVITGETGAGKSILMGALGLILGDRAEVSTLLDKDKKCIVEGIFSRPDQRTVDFLVSNNLDQEEEIIVRREISPTGKSRAFINDTPVTLAILKNLSEFLADLHRQFDTEELISRNFQLEVVDSLSDQNSAINEYKKRYQEYKTTKDALTHIKKEQEEALKESDYHQFLYDELEKANFSENEIEDLENEQKLMTNSGMIKENLRAADIAFHEGPAPVLQQIRSVISKIDQAAAVIPRLTPVVERLQSAYIELKDIASEIESAGDDISFSEQRMNDVNERLSEAYMLLKKHHVASTEELLKVKNNLENRLKRTHDLSENIETLQKEEKERYAEVLKRAEDISAIRKDQIKALPDKVDKLLEKVGMPNAAFKVDMVPKNVPDETGIDTITFLFNANKTGFQPLAKVASGGELSRLMLIIKSLVAEKMNLPTLIFDEIDSGISGEAARQVGNIIKKLSAGHQILLITHQPQIAARAYTHFYVFKEERGKRILTGIKKLNKEEQIEAVATMLSGNKPTEAAYENAKEMMK